jgi:hypothetical protein
LDVEALRAAASAASNAGASVINAFIPRPTAEVGSSATRTGVKATFFFDGTGNHEYVDRQTREHSNVARLYGIHPKPDSQAGMHPYYIPGIGTPFPAIGDEGGEFAQGVGRKGEARLEWAMRQLEGTVKESKGRQVRIALFGFSRGAALARAFARRIADRCKPGNGGIWRFAIGKKHFTVCIYFMGLFDTVASVGLPLSFHTTPLSQAFGWTLAQQAMDLRSVDGRGAASIAFGDRPGADPGFGPAHGHMRWADDLRVPAMVQSCLHLVASQEIRNSFPADSVRDGKKYPKGCREMLFPGAHADVGGGYRQGENARGAQPGAMLSLIALRGMRDEAVKAGVPLQTVLQTDAAKVDFGEDTASKGALKKMQARFKHFMDVAGWGGDKDLGAMLLAHRKVYFQWRFAQIKRDDAARSRKQPTQDQTVLREFEPRWAAEARRWQAQIAGLETELGQLDAKIGTLSIQHTAAARLAIAALNAERRRRHDQLVQVRARLATVPSFDGSFARNNAMYNRQLLADVLKVKGLAKKWGRAKLRPYYRMLLDAYDAEQAGKGLRDPEINAFFSEYVHDSLSGFARDATLPSDPRVVFVGDGGKLKYAGSQSPSDETTNGEPPAVAA